MSHQKSNSFHRRSLAITSHTLTSGSPNPRPSSQPIDLDIIALSRARQRHSCVVDYVITEEEDEEDSSRDTTQQLDRTLGYTPMQYDTPHNSVASKHVRSKSSIPITLNKCGSLSTPSLLHPFNNFGEPGPEVRSTASSISSYSLISQRSSATSMESSSSKARRNSFQSVRSKLKRHSFSAAKSTTKPRESLLSVTKRHFSLFGKSSSTASLS